MRSPRLLLFLAGAAVLPALPAAAGAATFCVSTTTPCAVPLHNLASVEAALAAAAANPGADTVRVGPRAGGHVGQFTYAGGDALTLAGEGIATTLLVGTGNQALAGIGTQVTVRDLTVRAPAGPGAIGVSLVGGTLDGVRVEGLGGTAVRAASGGTIEDSELVAPDGRAFEADGGSPVIRRSRLEGGARAFDERFAAYQSRFEGEGIDVGGPGGDVELHDVLVAVDRPDGIGLRVANGTLDADHVTVVHRGPAAAGTPGVMAAPGGALTLESSIVSGFPVALRRQASDEPVGPTDLVVRRSGYDLDAVVDVPGTSGGVTTLGPGNLDAEAGLLDDFRLRGDAAQVDAGIETGITALDLGGFARTVDGDGDGAARTDMGALEYRRQAPEVTLTAPASAVAGEPVPFAATGTDADGEPLTYAWSFGAQGAAAVHAFPGAGSRTVTVTATDPAGLSATASAVIAVAPAPGDTAPPLPGADTTAPVLSGQALSRRRFAVGGARGALTLTLSEPARVALSLERRRGRRWVAAPGARTLQLPAGGSRVAFRGRLGARLRPGRHRLVLAAVDAAGNRAVPVRLRFAVRGA